MSTTPVTAAFVLESLEAIGVPPCGTNEFESKELQKKCIVFDALLHSLHETTEEIVRICKTDDHSAYVEYMKNKQQD